MTTRWVYLLHFDRPVSERHTCQHYIGSADAPYVRLEEHRAGRGARLTQVANERGIGYRIVRLWEAEPGEGRKLERQLKRRKEAPALCPLCAERRKAPTLWDDWLEHFTLDDVGEMAF